jgi:hypothetical protein
MTELIPSPQEKREGVLRDHALALLANLEARLGLSAQEAGAFRAFMERIRREESEARRIHRQMADSDLGRTVRRGRRGSQRCLSTAKSFVPSLLSEGTDSS